MTEEERRLKQEKREKEVRRLKGFIFGAAALLLTGGVGYKIHEYKNKLTISKIDREIDIHTNHYELDGYKFDAYTEHSCEFEGEGDFVDRLANRMREEGYDEKTIEAAVEKFNLKFEHNYKEADEIDLNKISKSVKKTK